MAIILDGTRLSQKINTKIKNEILNLKSKPSLVAIQVGNNPESNLYLKHKEKKAQEVGINFSLLKLEENINEKDLIKEIFKLNSNKKIHGIMVQLPLPIQIDQNNISKSIDPSKDVDGFHPLNKGLLDINKAELIPPTANGVIKLFDEYNINLLGKVVTIIGQGEIAGKPLSKLLIHRGATIILCNKNTIDLSYFTKQSDIVISAVGYKHLVKENFIKNGSIVVNIGLTREEKLIFGDIEFEKIQHKTSYITPITGGTGPMTVSLLLENTLKCYKLINNVKFK
ncbi:MAG: bifunctional protein FolD [Candidatus Tyloplasma litorale]|nr:MAG: bifunctional protein FolD [Mycoplasmatales bacterium]